MCGKKMYQAVAGMAATTCVLLLAAHARADTHFVSPDGSDEHPYVTPETAARSIQAAVDAAEFGDAVEVSAGDYVEQVQLKEGLCLRGAGPGLTTIQRAFLGADYVVLGAADVRVEDLSVTHGPAYASHLPRIGIWLPAAPNQVVDNCCVSGPFATGIYCDGPVVGAPSVIVRSSVSGATDGVCCGRFVVLDRCTLQGNTWGAWTGDCEVLISGCDFVENTMGIYAAYTALTVECTRFVGGEWAIGQDEDYSVDLTMLASLVTGAKSAFLLEDSGEVTFLNCTICDNDVVFDIHMESVELVNCILWGNGTLLLEWPSQGTIIASHSDIQGGWAGDGNIDADPRFLNPAAGDYRLRRDSPCIDAGTTSRWELPRLEGPSRDLEGKRMPAYGGRTEHPYAYPDMGAYEYYMFHILPEEETDLPRLTWTAFYGVAYSILYSDDLIAWHLAITERIAPDEYVASWTDDGSKTAVPPSLAPRRFYRILENP